MERHQLRIYLMAILAGLAAGPAPSGLAGGLEALLWPLLALLLFATFAQVPLGLALALGEGWQMASVVIVAQLLVELVGVVGLLWLVPRELRTDVAGQFLQRRQSATDPAKTLMSTGPRMPGTRPVPVYCQKVQRWPG